MIGRVFGAAQQIRSANVFPFNLPPIIGLSTSGGFEYQLQNLEGRDPAEMGSVHARPGRRGQPGPAADPRVLHLHRRPRRAIFLDIDRDKAQALGVSISDVFTALQATLGGFYVNDFNLFGRTWQVNIQGEAADRDDIADDLAHLRAQQARARWCRCAPSPTRASCSGRRRSAATTTTAPSPINGAPAPGVSSGDALAAMEQISRAHAAAGLRLRMDRHGLPGEAGRAGRPACILGAGGAVRLPVPGGALRELDDPDAGAAVGRGRRARRLRRPAASPACRSTSMRRSAWWC